MDKSSQIKLFATYSIREPKKKKQSFKSTNELKLDLPIPISDPLIKNVENASKLLSGSYRALLKDKRVFVESEWDAKVLYNCGYFGHGEYSKSEASLNKIIPSKAKNPNQQTEEDFEECSINVNSILPMPTEKYANRTMWSQIAKSDNCLTDFHSKFLREFVEANVKQRPKEQENFTYCKIPIEINQMDKCENSTRNENAHPIIKNYLKLNPANDLFSFKIKKMPSYQLNETHTLMHEEAFFLAFGLDCLTVFDEEQGKELTLEELWSKLCQIDSNFPFKYAVYHKIRSKGWIVKNGLKYGCDFIVYFEGPDKYHASFSVRVRKKDMNYMSDEFLDNLENENFNEEEESDECFTQFAAFIRVNETASKQVMICYVFYDTSDRTFDLNHPSCIGKLSILESLIERWVPKESRDNNNLLAEGSLSTKNTKSIYDIDSD